MSTSSQNISSRQGTLRDLSPSGQRAAHFFRALARALKTCRLYRGENPIVTPLRPALLAQLNEDLLAAGSWHLRFTPFEILLIDEPVVRPAGVKLGVDATPTPEERLPFLFYRDGIRSLVLTPEVPRHEFDALFDALLVVGVNSQMQDDLVTLLWQANTTKIRVDAVPVSQTIFLHSRRPTSESAEGSHQGLSYAWSPNGSEIRADIGQIEGASMGLHRDTFDDWPLPTEWVEVAEAYSKLDRTMQFTRTRLLTEWAAERGIEWQDEAPQLLQAIHVADPDSKTSAAIARALVTWVVGSIQDCNWEEAQRAFELLRRFDPDGAFSNDDFSNALQGLDTDDITEHLDESTTDDQGRFFGLTVAIGRPAVKFACAVMAKAQKSRTRAAACTMLTYLCTEDPEVLEPYITDSRWYVVRNVVFILGQIGGPAVVPMLEMASHHPEMRVRRAVVQALGNVPATDRVPLLFEQLGTRDPQLLAAALGMLARFRTPAIARAVLRQVEAPDFETRAEESQRALFNALGELGDDEIVPRLEILLHKGGWFARSTFERIAAARTLQRIGTQKAISALATGLRSRAEAVRNACLEAMNTRSA
ncbi:MAG: HEAT repeat domain-containing protein [Candidatus Eisenbacteria bacterium]|uniref:HEAT repeat domain-containing protein n=1 Tax=Eiseniibacteriota bacterium TaxID=2212470 RepID=A0A849SID0_UNCEI|nr:HEAT repeat domain-containing protein [Candidatus Eisenbacteria bacterium]